MSSPVEATSTAANAMSTAPNNIDRDLHRYIEFLRANLAAVEKDREAELRQANLRVVSDAAIIRQLQEENERLGYENEWKGMIIDSTKDAVAFEKGIKRQLARELEAECKKHEELDQQISRQNAKRTELWGKYTGLLKLAHEMEETNRSQRELLALKEQGLTTAQTEIKDLKRMVRSQQTRISLAEAHIGKIENRGGMTPPQTPPQSKQSKLSPTTAQAEAEEDNTLPTDSPAQSGNVDTFVWDSTSISSVDSTRDEPEDEEVDEVGDIDWNGLRERKIRQDARHRLRKTPGKINVRGLRSR